MDRSDKGILEEADKENRMIEERDLCLLTRSSMIWPTFIGYKMSLFFNLKRKILMMDGETMIN